MRNEEPVVEKGHLVKKVTETTWKISSDNSAIPVERKTFFEDLKSSP